MLPLLLASRRQKTLRNTFAQPLAFRKASTPTSWSSDRTLLGFWEFSAADVGAMAQLVAATFAFITSMTLFHYISALLCHVLHVRKSFLMIKSQILKSSHA